MIIFQILDNIYVGSKLKRRKQERSRLCVYEQSVLVEYKRLFLLVSD